MTRRRRQRFRTAKNGGRRKTPPMKPEICLFTSDGYLVKSRSASPKIFVNFLFYVVWHEQIWK